MATIAETITPQKVLEFSQAFSFTDIQWLIKQLKKRVEEKPLPDNATLNEAVELYLENKCSLGRAAELAGVTRWDIQDALSFRGISIEIDSSQSVEEMDAMTKRLEQKGLLCSLVSDTNIPSSLAAGNALSSISLLFPDTPIYIPPTVYQELQIGLERGKTHLNLVLEWIATRQISILELFSRSQTPFGNAFLDALRRIVFSFPRAGVGMQSGRACVQFIITERKEK